MPPPSDWLHTAPLEDETTSVRRRWVGAAGRAAAAQRASAVPAPQHTPSRRGPPPLLFNLSPDLADHLAPSSSPYTPQLARAAPPFATQQGCAPEPDLCARWDSSLLAESSARLPAIASVDGLLASPEWAEYAR